MPNYRWLVLLSLLADCAKKKPAEVVRPPVIKSAPVGTGAVQSQTIDAHGGTLSLENVTLNIPPGALAAGQSVTVTSTTAAAPSAFTAYSPVYQFTPEGLTFALPVTVTMPYDGTSVGPAIYWSKLGAAGYDQLPTVVNGTTLVATTLHFSSAFVAEAQVAMVVASPTVTGRKVNTYVTDDLSGSGTQTANVPSDLSAHPPLAFAPNGSGGFASLSVSGNADGTFTVQDVLPGVYYLETVDDQHVQNWYVTTARDIDLSTFVIGRADVQLMDDAAAANTELVLSVTDPNFAAWHPFDDVSGYPGDDVQLYSSTNGSYNLEPQYDSELGTFTFPWGQTGDAVVPIASDETVFVRLTEQAPGADGTLYSTITDASAPTAFALTQGSSDTPADNSLTVSMSPLTSAQQTTVAVNWTRTACDAYRPFGARTDTFNYGVYIDAQPGGVGRGQLGGTPDLLVIALAGQITGGVTAIAVTDLEVGNVTLGNPFPATWDVFAIPACSFTGTYTLPGAFPSTPLHANVAGNKPLSSLTGGALDIDLGPVTGLTVDGQDATADVDGAALTPVVQWTPPSLGTATSYTVKVKAMSLDANNHTVLQDVASIRTTAPTLVMPPGILVAGTSYALLLTAYYTGDVDREKYPDTPAMPNAIADLWSGIITTGAR